MYATWRTLLQGSHNDSKSFGKITNLIFPRALTKCSDLYIISVRWSLLAHRLTISQIRQYLMSICWSNHRVRDSSIIESHLWLLQRVTVVFIMSTNSSLKSFPNQATSYEIILVDMYPVSAVLTTTDFCFLLIHNIEAESEENQH